MHMLSKLGTAFIGLLFAGSTAVSAAGATEIPEKPIALIPKEVAVETAQKAAGGKLLEMEWETKIGRLYYNIEVLDSSGYLHKMYVDALTGELTESSRENTRTPGYQKFNEVKTSAKEAMDKVIAVKAGGRVNSLSLERVDTNLLYNVELADAAGVSYKAQMNAQTGEILRWVRDKDVPANTKPGITLTQANSTALGAKGVLVIESVLVYEDGVLCYKVMTVDSKEKVYRTEVDASTGKILKQKWDD